MLEVQEKMEEVEGGRRGGGGVWGDQVEQEGGIDEKESNMSSNLQLQIAWDALRNLQMSKLQFMNSKWWFTWNK